MAITDPTDITGCRLWLDPSTITGLSDGGSVTSWTDQSGNANDVSTVVGTSPVYDDGSSVIHGKPGVRYGDRTDERLEVTDATLDNATFTYCYVTLTKVATANSFIFGKETSDGPLSPGLRHNITGSSESRFEAVFQFGANQKTQNQAGYTGYFTDIHIIRFDGSNRTHWINGEKVSEVADTATHSSSSGKFSVGNHPTADASSPGITYDVAVYDNAITDTDVADWTSWARDKYPCDWTLDGLEFSDEFMGNLFVDGTTAYLVSVGESGSGFNEQVFYRTASTSTPNSWGSRNNLFNTQLGSQGTRGVCLVKEGSTWYLYYDNRANGEINLATGSTLGSLSDVAGNPIITGSGTPGADDEFVRFPFVITPSQSHDSGWHALVDGRANGAQSPTGAIYHYTSTDGESWTQQEKILDATGGTNDHDRSDVGAPSAVLRGGTYYIAYQSFNELEDGRGGGFPHYLNFATSTDLTAANTQKDAGNPILPYSYGIGAPANGNTGIPNLYEVGGNELWIYYQGHSYDAVGNRTDTIVRASDTDFFGSGASITGSGSVQAQAASVTGFGERIITGTAAVQADPATASGTDTEETFKSKLQPGVGYSRLYSFIKG